MPKFKPKAILSRVLLGKSRQKEDGLDYLSTGLQCYLRQLNSHAYIGRANQDDDHDDSNSICSFSTTATADNLPGTGRTVDTYIYQPAGRWIERVAMRFTIASLHPARIAQYLDANDTQLAFVHNDQIKLHDAIAQLCRHGRNGSTVVAGMKGLVKQTQSNSIDRSASALAALIRVSLIAWRPEIYTNVSRIEPIFHLETLVRSHPDEKWLLLLVKLAKESLIAVRRPLDQRTDILQLRPSLESAQKLRQRLIRVLKIYRLSGLDSLGDTIGESCAICAEAISTWISWFARGNAYKHILETVYFTVIFILRSIHGLADSASITANKHIYMVLQTIACWIDAFVHHCIDAIGSGVHRFDMDLLKVDIAFRSLIVDGDTFNTYSFRDNGDTPVVDTRSFPNRYRGEGTRPIQGLFEAANHRTLRLLRSFNELEREVWGCASRINISILQLKIDADPHWAYIDDFGDEWLDYWRSTLKWARRVQVPETILTEEFREARRIGLFYDNDYYDDDYGDDLYRDWRCYQLRRGARHKWGQYLRSNLDWDWDLATCLTRLFKVEKQIRGGPSRTAPVPSSAIDVAAGPGGTLEISMGDAQEEGFPKEMQVAYTTKAGETRYMSYAPVGSNPGFQLDFETDTFGPSAVDPMEAQQVSDHRKESLGGEQVLENPETDAFPPQVSRPNACEDTPVEGSKEGSEWEEPVYVAGCDEVRAGEDTISICSLD